MRYNMYRVISSTRHRPVCRDRHQRTRDARAMKLLEEENRWLKAQLFGRSSEKTPREERHPDQAWLFNEARGARKCRREAPETVTIPAHERAKRGRKKTSAALPRVDVIHDLSEAEKAARPTARRSSGSARRSPSSSIIIPATDPGLQHIRPKYACPCCRSGVRIAPVPVTLFPKSILTPSLLAQITTAKFVDGTPLYRQEPQFGRLGIALGRGTMACG